MLWMISTVRTILWLLGRVRSHAKECSFTSCWHRPGSFRDEDWRKKLLVCRTNDQGSDGDGI